MLFVTHDQIEALSLRGHAAPAAILAAGTPAHVAVRPEDIEVTAVGGAPADANTLLGTVDFIFYTRGRSQGLRLERFSGAGTDGR